MPQAAPRPNDSSADGGDVCASTDAEPPIGLHIDVVHEGGDWGAIAQTGDWVRAAAAALGAELGVSGSEACVALSTDRHVAELNGTYRGKPVPTNVLSFPASGQAGQGGAQSRFLGDVVLAHETLSREAAELGLPLESHLQHLIVHGLLHLLGYDHETHHEAQKMEALEVRILGRLGIADPYAAAGEPPLTPQRHETKHPKP